MTIKNPYAVGNSGAQAREAKVTCRCCQLPTSVWLGPRDFPTRITCGPCRHHVLDGTPNERLEALEDHATRAREFGHRAYSLLKAGMTERDQAIEERRRLGRALYEANEERDYLRSQLRGAWDLHVESPRGGCSCGETPCPTREEANKIDERFGHPFTRWIRVPIRL